MRELDGVSLRNLETLPRRLALGWVTFDGTAGTLQAFDHENVSSLTDNGATGDYTITWARQMANGNYAPMTFCRDSGVILGVQDVPLAGSVRVITQAGGPAQPDSAIICVAAVGANA